MAKKERLEDLGIIYQKLDALVSDFESDYPYFDSKHAYEVFQEKVIADDCEKMYDFHVKMRYFLSELNEIIYIARGDIE